jgi:hypothetical protein
LGWRDRRPRADLRLHVPTLGQESKISYKSGVAKGWNQVVAAAQDEPRSDAEFAAMRRPDRTYVSRSFDLGLSNSSDYGQPTRYVRHVFDETPSEDHEINQVDLFMLRHGKRKQIQLQVSREAGSVRELCIQEVKTGAQPAIRQILRLNRDESKRLTDLFSLLPAISPSGDETQQIDDRTLSIALTEPEILRALYNDRNAELREMIATDETADDVIGLSRRRAAVERFRRLLEDDELFDRESETKGPESVWQTFFESNPWIFGVGLSGQLLTSLDDRKLEQVVSGASIGTPGKRADGVLRTVGAVRSVVFAEIKHHRTPLLSGKEYRSDCWQASSELSGGVVQSQQTVHSAVENLGSTLAETEADGSLTGDYFHLLQPRTFLVVGHLEQLRGSAGGTHMAKHRSFELFRRNLLQPEIVTFDELLARAEWHVEAAQSQSPNT